MAHEYHTPVLCKEILNYVPDAPGSIVVDGTVGGGGHAEQLLLRLPPDGKLVCFDMDDEALSFAQKRLQKFGDRVMFIKDNFRNIRPRLQETGIGSVDGILLDLGVSSHQIDDKKRGFSFLADQRIDMRMNRAQRLDGWTVVNAYEPERLLEIIREYGEERFASRIVRNIVKARTEHTIDTNAGLGAMVEAAVGPQHLQKSLARVFQAIRIEVNSELENLRIALEDSLGVLAQGGRLMVISYHSLEDRIVKHFIRKESQTILPSGNKLVPDTLITPNLRELTKKPIVPDEDELRSNPRSRSAKLRVAERV